MIFNTAVLECREVIIPATRLPLILGRSHTGCENDIFFEPVVDISGKSGKGKRDSIRLFTPNTVFAFTSYLYLFTCCSESAARKDIMEWLEIYNRMSW